MLAHDPERIGYVREVVARIQRGDTIYSTTQWLNEVGAPLPTASQATRKRAGWKYGTVERLVRHPVLAGMTPFNPGGQEREDGKKEKTRGDEVLRDADGLPVVDESVAIMPVGEWRAMVRQLDARDSGRAKPRAMRSKTSALLSGLVVCGHCDDDGEPVRMHRGTINKRPGYSCPRCHQSASNFEDHVVAEFLRMKGERVRWSVVEEVHEGGAAMLPEIEHALTELTARLMATDDDDEAAALTGQIGNLRAMRLEARQKPANVVYRPVRGTRMFGEDWAEAESVEDRRAILDDALRSVTVRRGRVGRGLDTTRFKFDWRVPEDLGPDVVPDDATLADWSKHTA